MTGATSPPLRILLVGAGYAGRLHLAAAQNLPSAQYVGVVDIDPERAREVAVAHGLPHFSNLASAVGSTQAQAVDICVPTLGHLAVAEMAAAHGLHILCEKPIALTLEDALAMRAAARSAGVRLMIGEIIRFWPEYAEAVRICRSGRFGGVRAIHSRRLATAPLYNEWMLDLERGGSAVIDLQIHDVTFLMQILGEPSAVEGHAYGVDEGRAIFNRLIYPGGVLATNEASFLLPRDYLFRAQFQIHLEDATLEMDGWSPAGQQLYVFPRDGERFAPDVANGNPYERQLDYFARTTSLGEEQDFVPIDESIMALRICLASLASSRAGRPVEIR